MKCRLAIFVATSLVSAGVALAQPKQPAPQKVDCQWFEVKGSNTKGAQLTVDKDLGPIDKKLHEPAWSAWNTYKKLAGGTATLVTQTPQDLSMKEGKASILFDSQVGKSKLRLKVTMDNAKGKRTVDTTAVIEAGDYIVWANQDKASDTAHMLAVSCK